MESKVERSMSAQTRVDIVSLAKLDKYWVDEGRIIRTMSQLISWSLDLLVEIMEANGRAFKIDDIIDAHNWLEYRGLYQRSLKDRNMKKLGTAFRFQSMRDEGVEPSSYAPRQHKTLHNSHSVKALDVRQMKVSSGRHIDEIEAAFEQAAKERDREIAERENSEVDTSELNIAEDE